MRLHALILLLAVVPWLGGCVAGPARSVGSELAGGFFDQAEDWWAKKSADVAAAADVRAKAIAADEAGAAKTAAVAEAKDAARDAAAGAQAGAIAEARDLAADAKAFAGELGRRFREEAVDLAAAKLSPAIDAGAERAVVRAHELVDAKLGPAAAGVKDLVLATLEPKVQAQVDQQLATLRALGWAAEELETPGAVAGGVARRAAAGNWEEAKAGLLTFLGMLAALGVRGGIRIMGEKSKPTS